MMKTEELRTRPFQNTDQAYQALIELKKLLDPEEQLTVEMIRRSDESFAEFNQSSRVVGELDGKVVASGAYWHELDEPAKPQFALFVHPDYQTSDVPQQMQNHILSQLEQQKPQTIASDVLENQQYRIDLLEASGFARLMRFPRSQQDVTSFDPQSYQAVLDSVAWQGIVIKTLTEVMAQDPEWQRNVWHLFTQIEQDIPTPHPEEMTPFEVYAQYYEGEFFQPDSWSIALDTNQQGKEQYVGMCVVNAIQSRPGALFAGITGVIRSYRRRKIATALKISSVAYARQNGFHAIRTDNEENNPMYQLNLNLGFQPLPASLYYEKKMNDFKKKTADFAD